MTVWARHSHLFFNTIPKFSTHVHHVTGIVRKSKKRTITYNCRNFIEWYGYTWYHFCFPNDLPAKPMIHIICLNTMLQAVIQIRRANNSVDYIACLEFMFRLFLKKKNRGVTGIHTSIVRYNWVHNTIKYIYGYVSEAPKRLKWNT